MEQELAAERATHEATKRQLATANKARAHESKVASKRANEAAAEISELKKEVEHMHTEAEASAMEKNDLIVAKRKLQSYNEQPKRNIEEMRLQIQAVQNASELPYESTPLRHMRRRKRKADQSDQ
jgi:hypothetical protein